MSNVQELASHFISEGCKASQLAPIAVSGHGTAQGKWGKAGLKILERAVSGKADKQATKAAR